MPRLKAFQALAAVVLVAASLAYFKPNTPTHLTKHSWTLQTIGASELDPVAETSYELAFAALAQGDWKAADSWLAKAENPILQGHLLAARYLSASYTSTPEELANWLSAYADLPQASDIYALAQRKKAPLRNLASMPNSRSLNSYGDNQTGEASFDGTAYANTWQQALTSFQKNDKRKAADLFARIADHKGLSDWRMSAAAYWAFRGYKDVGRSGPAMTYLKRAAENPRTFYGILAREQLGKSISLNTRAEYFHAGALHDQRIKNAARRIMALNEINQSKLAEDEIRHAFVTANLADRRALLALAHQYRMASAEMSIASVLETEKTPLDFARYPIPDWKPHGGFYVDSALIYALVRQESGFRETAHNASGAHGLMQLMPSTARSMQTLTKLDTSAMQEPIVNITLGQNYVQHLLKNGLVDENLIYMLTAYNAGSSRLQEWKDSHGTARDPLLFIETMPYRETKHYVMQVMTNYWIYSELLGQKNTSADALANNRWPSYSAHSKPSEFKDAG